MVGWFQSAKNNEFLLMDDGMAGEAGRALFDVLNSSVMGLPQSQTSESYRYPEVVAHLGWHETLYS